MKRVGQLFEQIASRDNLRLGFWKASRGKRDRVETIAFESMLDARLRNLQAGLLEETVEVGRFHQFVVHDPKERVITAPCFEERVIHHAVMNVCEPIFERRLIDDTFACRVGRGRHAAIDRAYQFARSHDYFLKLDIRKYFDSVPHCELVDGLSRLFKDARLMRLFERIIRSFRSDQGCGLPIGSLMSQHFANHYLGLFDRFVKESLRVRGYVRYMDDFVLWGADSREMKNLSVACSSILKSTLRLTTKPSCINRTTHGMDFLGCRIFPHVILLNRRSRIRFRRKLTHLLRCHSEGLITDAEIQKRMTSLVGFTRSANISSWQFRSATIRSMAENGQKARTG